MTIEARVEVISFFEEMTRLGTKLSGEGDINGVKAAAAALLQKSGASLDAAEHQRLLTLAAPIFSASCGCAEDLEYVLSVLDPLLEKKLVDQEFVDKVVAKSACNRWM